MVLMCHMIWEDHMIKVSHKHLKVSDHPAKFGGQRHSGSGDVFEFVA